MTRFARAKGSKASNERAPDDSTPWEVIKEQLLKSKQESEEAKKREKAEKQRIENYENFLKEQKVQKKKATWCDFPETVNDHNNYGHQDVTPRKKKKKNKQKSAYTEEVDTVERIATKESNINNRTTQSDSIVPNNQNNYDQQDASPKKKKRKNKQKSAHTEELDTVEILGSKGSNINNSTTLSDSIVEKTYKERKNKHDKVQLTNTEGQKDYEGNHCENSVNGEPELNYPTPKKKKKKNKHNKTDIISDKSICATVNTEDNESKVDSKDSKNTKKNNQIKPEKQQNKEKNHKNRKDKKFENGEAARRKPLTDRSFQLIINGKEVELVRFDGFPIMKKDAERLEELKNNMVKKGIPKSEVQRTIKLERRRAEKALARLKRDVCYNCRKGGHNLSDCPELKSKIPGTEAPDGVCFKCGSTEHRQFECKVQRDKEFRFATCFICKEAGHIARQCPDNPKGLYPNGGCCKLCGDVTHLRKDCPTVKDKKEETSIKLQTLDNAEDIEGISQKMKMTLSEETVKKPKKIKF